jgi:NADPH:quinone reductase-like Zn-dependent oxidoreductase
MTMKRGMKVLSGIGAVLLLGIATLGIAMSRNSACGAAAPLAADADTMKAVVYRCYGGPEVLRYEDVAKPAIESDRVLIRVHSASANPLDWHYLRGEPYIMRTSSGFGSPEDIRLGVDFAGTVEAVGAGVTRFKPGDEVFGGAGGAFAEYVNVREAGALALKPANVTFEQAAAVPIAAVTALQALRDKGQVRAGQRVLINGASGGVGTFAVQLAKSYGAVVTGVCSTRNVELVRSAGADHVVDYTQRDFTQGTDRYDLIIDSVGNHSFSALRGVMQPNGVLVMVGNTSKGRWLGPLLGSIKGVMLAPFVKQRIEPLLADMNAEDLALLAGLMASGKLTPVIDRSFSLSDVAQAIEYLETGRARGKVVIAVSGQ